MAAMAGDALSLDVRIRDYVLLPISVVVFMQGMLRDFISHVLAQAPKRPKTDDARRSSVLRRSATFRMYSHLLPEDAAHARQAAILKQLKDIAADLKPGEDEDIIAPQSLDDMSNMTDMMKQNVANILPNMLSMGWVTYFFSGFVLVKLPFPLTSTFKPMLQQGVHIHNLDSSYVSSLSWYFLNLFGMRGLFSLILGSRNAADGTQAMYQQMSAMQGQGPGMRSEAHKPFERESVELEITTYENIVSGAEYRLLGEPVPRPHSD